MSMPSSKGGGGVPSGGFRRGVKGGAVEAIGGYMGPMGLIICPMEPMGPIIGPI